MPKPNPFDHSCWRVTTHSPPVRIKGITVVANEVASPVYIGTERTCPACAYERGVEYGEAHSCDHHRAFALELGRPLLCPECGAEVQVSVCECGHETPAHIGHEDRCIQCCCPSFRKRESRPVKRG